MDNGILKESIKFTLVLSFRMTEAKMCKTERSKSGGALGALPFPSFRVTLNSRSRSRRAGDDHRGSAGADVLIRAGSRLRFAAPCPCLSWILR